MIVAAMRLQPDIQPIVGPKAFVAHVNEVWNACIELSITESYEKHWNEAEDEYRRDVYADFCNGGAQA